MATITSAQSGRWDLTTTWTGGVVPTASDRVEIYHTITVQSTCYANYLIIYPGGGLITSPDLNIEASLHIGSMIGYRRTMTPAPFRLDGIPILHSNGKPYTCLGNIGEYSTDGYPTTNRIEGGGGVIIDDTGIYNASATLQDIKPEGCSRAYARKVSNAVRYLTMTVRIQRGHQGEQEHIREIYAWAEMPFQVIAMNGSCAIKGYVESVVYDKASVGTAYHVLQVTIAEGQQ